MIDLGCLVIIALFAYFGWRRGLLQAVLALLGVVAGYLAAYLLYRPLGDLLASLLSLQPLLAYPLGGMTAFFLAPILVGLVSLILRRRARRRGALPPALPSRVGGAVVGGLWGAAFSLLIVWALVLVQALSPDLPDARGSLAGRLATPLSARLFSAAARQASGSEALAGVAGRFAGDPIAVSKGLGAVLDHEGVQSMLKDPRVARALASGRAGAGESAGVRTLAGDRRFLEAARAAGFVSIPPDGLTPEDARRQVAAGLAPLARTVQTLARDPEVQRLLGDRDLVGRIERRELLGLMNDQRFNRLATIILTQLRAQSGLPGVTPSPTGAGSAERTAERPATPSPAAPAPSRRVHRWKDRRGVQHYSDQPQP